MKKVYIETYGCAMNQADSETMEGILKKRYTITKDINDSDIIIINTCTVKDATERNFVKRLNVLKKLNKPVIITGCLAQLKKFDDFSVVGVDQIKHIDYVVKETLSGNIVKLVKQERTQRLALPYSRKNNLIEIIPISQGCVGECTYCQTKFARGRLFSYEKEAIISRVKKAINNGAKEIWLTSQDTGAYGLDIKTNIVELLKEILEINCSFKLRLGMANPNFVYYYKEELAEIFKNKKMYKFLHIPVQSGSDEILEKMKRNYKIKQFYELFKYFKKNVPNITISTDIIVGFPEECDKDFEKTKKLLLELKPEVVNISKFSLRPGIEASQLRQVDKKTISERSKELSSIFRKYAEEQKKKYKDKEINVFFNEMKNKSLIGRTDNYLNVVHNDNRYKLGEERMVKIIDTKDFYLVC